jgi:hypothetical protein
MPELEFYLVSRDVSVDRDTNSLSILNVLEEVGLDEGELEDQDHPALIPRLAVTSLWNFPPEERQAEYAVHTVVTLPSGEEIEIPAVEIQPDSPKHRVFNRVQGLPVGEVGEILFTVFIDDEPRGTHTVHVQGAGEVEDAVAQEGQAPAE